MNSNLMMPLYSVHRASLQEGKACMMGIGHIPEWKSRCQVLIKYLQSQDLSLMPEALQQKLYVILTEIVRVLGDRQHDRQSKQTRKWSQTLYNLQEATKSFMTGDISSRPHSLGSVDLGTLLAVELPKDPISSTTELNKLQQQLDELKKDIQAKQALIQELRDLYKEAVLEGESYMVEQYSLKEQLNSEITRLNKLSHEKTLIIKEHQQEILMLRALINQKDRMPLKRVDSGIEFHMVQEPDEETMTMHSMTRPMEDQSVRGKKIKKNQTRRPSVSIASNEQSDITAFETEVSEAGSSRPMNRANLLQKRVDELEADLRIKEQVLTAINSFIEAEGESILGEKSTLTDLLKRCELKQKYKSYCDLAEQNAYLKKCMDKLTKSEEFWSKMEERQLEADDRKKCSIF